MTAQIVANGISKRYFLGQSAALPRLDVRHHGRNLWRRLRRQPVVPITLEDQPTIWALKDVSFELEAGQRLGIIGRNGSGKSTLLKILTRITDPTQGRASLQGRVASLLEVGTGFHPDLTGRENILLNGAVLGMTRGEIRRKFDEIVAFADIDQFIDTPVKYYSSGMYVRLAFAVAAHLESEILIVDEVLAVGDASFQRKCLGKIEDDSDGGRTLLFVSHSTSLVARLCTHGLLLDGGQVKAYGNAAEVVHDYLGRQTGTRTVSEFPNKPKEPIVLRRVELNPGASIVSNEVSYEEDVALRIEYQVNEPVEDVMVWMAMQTMDGQYVFVTSDCDVDQSRLGVRRPGYYTADICIRGKFLNAGEYVAVVGFNKRDPARTYARNDTVSFKILDIGTPARITWDSGRPGPVQPYLHWETRAT